MFLITFIAKPTSTTHDISVLAGIPTTSDADASLDLPKSSSEEQHASSVTSPDTYGSVSSNEVLEGSVLASAHLAVSKNDSN